MRFKQVFYILALSTITSVLPLEISAHTAHESDTISYNINTASTQYSDNDEFMLPLYPDYEDFLTRSTSFGYSFLRYNPRGYPSRYSTFTWNGLQIADFWTGAPPWAELTGLGSTIKTETRYRGADFDILGSSIGSIAGQTVIANDLPFNKRTKATYSISNRTYTNRLTAQYQSGFLKKNWNINAELSRRWGRSLSIAGLFADSWTAAINAGKALSDNKHRLDFTLFFAPTQRSTAQPASQEAFKLTGNNLYNPAWGYQAEKQRSAKTASTITPIAIITHTFTINPRTRLFTSALASIGQTATTALNWQTAPNPQPDYYSYMPSATTSPTQAQILTDMWRTNPAVSQINFDELYHFNNTSPQAHYIIENRIKQITRIAAQSTLNKHFGHTILSTGIQIKYTSENRYKTIEDLLGAKYWLDIDYFTEQDDDYKVLTQNNMDDPNRHVEKNGKFGYYYNLQNSSTKLWAAAEHNIKNWYFTMAASTDFTTLARYGHWQKQMFPDRQSLGKSPTLINMEYTLKAIIEYRLGKKLSASLSMIAQNVGPTPQNSFFDPEYRNEFIPNLSNENILSSSLQLKYTTNNLRIYSAIYYTSITDQTQLTKFYDDRKHLYTNLVLQNIDTRYMGVELSLETPLYNDLWIRGAAALTDNRYTNNPYATSYYQTTGALLSSETIFYKDLRTPLSPQSVGSVAIAYQPYSWNISLTINAFSGSFINPSPARYNDQAITDAAKPIEMIEQEKFNHGFTLDIFGGKTFTLPNYSRIGLYIGISNITNNRGIKTAGYQSNRLMYSSGKYSPQASKYYYALGINGFINISYSF